MSIELLREIHKYAKGLTADAATVTAPELESALAEIDAFQSRLAAAERAIEGYKQTLASQQGFGDRYAERLAAAEARAGGAERDYKALRELFDSNPNAWYSRVEQAEARAEEAQSEIDRLQRNFAAAEAGRLEAERRHKALLDLYNRIDDYNSEHLVTIAELTRENGRLTAALEAVEKIIEQLDEQSRLSSMAAIDSWTQVADEEFDIYEAADDIP